MIDVDELVRKMQHVLKVATNHRKLLVELANDSELLFAAMIIQGVSRENIKVAISYAKSSSDSPLNKLLRLDRCHGLLSYVSKDAEKSERNYGVADLILSGSELSEELRIRFRKWLPKCSIKQILIHRTATPDQLRDMALRSLSGSRNSSDGIWYQNEIACFINRQGLDVHQNESIASSHTWDIVDKKLKVIVEVTTIDTTASGTSTKKNAALADIESLSNKGYTICFLATGEGLKRRQSDYRSLANKCHFFGDVVEFLHFYLNEKASLNLSEESLKRFSRQLSKGVRE